MEMNNNQFNINTEMLQIARQQFCLDTCLDWQQYLEQPDRKVYIQKMQYEAGTSYPVAKGARRYAGMDSFFKAIMCMGQLFLAVDEQIYDWAVEQFAECAPQWFCEYNNLRKIDEKLQEYGRTINDTHLYYLPAVAGASNDGMEMQLACYQWYEQEDILRFKEGNLFTSAICFSPTQPDMLAVAAMRERDTAIPTYDQTQMAGMAGVSEDGAYLWQIGINVVPECAGRGLAVSLVQQIKEEIIRRGKVPFYGTSESHTVSQTVGLKAGFVPAWTEIYVREIRR